MVISADRKQVVPQEGGASQNETLEKQAARGTVYVVVYYGVSLSLRMVSSVILARLFSPEYFGVMTLLTTVLIGLNLFSHIGLADSVIQNPRGDDPVFLNTAWTLQVVRGAGLWVLTILLAWPVARFYHEPRTLTLFPALGFACVIAGASSPSLLSLARHLGVGKLFNVGTSWSDCTVRRHAGMGLHSAVTVGAGRRETRLRIRTNGGQLLSNSGSSSALCAG